MEPMQNVIIHGCHHFTLIEEGAVVICPLAAAIRPFIEPEMQKNEQAAARS
jgi:hypothetical protein